MCAPTPALQLPVTREYDSHTTQQAKEAGKPVSLRAARVFAQHQRDCPVCNGSTYAYARCSEGLRYARAIFGLDNAVTPPKIRNGRSHDND
jgi:hypothetical protein